MYTNKKDVYAGPFNKLSDSLLLHVYTLSSTTTKWTKSAQNTPFTLYFGYQNMGHVYER